MKHTKGPWIAGKFSDNGFNLTTSITTNNNSRLVAEVYSGVPYVNMDETPEDRANAQLIAAAPEMLEALKLAEKMLRDRNDAPFFEAWPYIKAAIAKAEGE